MRSCDDLGRDLRYGRGTKKSRRRRPQVVDSMMGGRTLTVLADPLSDTFQLTNSRPALCSVLTACGAKTHVSSGDVDVK